MSWAIAIVSAAITIFAAVILIVIFEKITDWIKLKNHN